MSSRMATPRFCLPQHSVSTSAELVHVRPEDLPGVGVEGEHLVLRGRHVHHAVHDERRRLHLSEGVDLTHPCQLEVANGVLVDLSQPAESLAVILPGVHHPVAGMFIGACEGVAGDLRMNVDRRGDEQQGTEQSPRGAVNPHVSSPLLRFERGEIRDEVGHVVIVEPSVERRHQRFRASLDGVEIGLGKRPQLLLAVEQLD